MQYVGRKCVGQMSVSRHVAYIGKVPKPLPCEEKYNKHK